MPTRSVLEDVTHTLQEHCWAGTKTGNPFFVFSFF
jgi:hypothetical protein